MTAKPLGHEKVEPLHPSLWLWVEILGPEARSQSLTAVVYPQRRKKDGQDMLQAPRQQDQRAIHIAPAARPTGTEMPAFPQRFFDHRATGMTPLGRLQGTRRGLDIHDTSFCRFVSQDAEKLRRGTVENRFVETGFGCRTVREVLSRGLVLFGLRTARHVGRLELFREDRRRPVHHDGGLLVVEVQSLSRNRAMQLCHPLIGQTPPTGELLLRISGLVRGFQLRLALPQKAWVGTTGGGGVVQTDGGNG